MDKKTTLSFTTETVDFDQTKADKNIKENGVFTSDPEMEGEPNA